MDRRPKRYGETVLSFGAGMTMLRLGGCVCTWRKGSKKQKKSAQNSYHSYNVVSPGPLYLNQYSTGAYMTLQLSYYLTIDSILEIWEARIDI